MRLFGMFLVFCLAYNVLIAQNAYYDAKAVYSLDAKQLDELDDYKNLLTRSNDRTDWRNIRSFAKDPFEYIEKGRPSFNVQVINKLKEYQENYDVIRNDKGKVVDFTPLNSVYNSAFSPSNMLDKTAGLVDALFGGTLGPDMDSRFIDATATLLYERTKAELTVSYLFRLKEAFEARPFLLNEENSFAAPDTFYLKDLFPSTYSILLDFQRVLSINVGKSLQNALEEDLKDFFENADKCLIPRSIKSELPYQLLTSVYFSFKDLSKGAHPSVMLSTLCERFSVEGLSRPNTAIDTFSFAINLIRAVSDGLEDISPDRVWVSMDDFKRMSIREVEYFICLLFLKNVKLFQGLGIEATRISDGLQSYDFRRLQGLIARTVEFVDQVENKIADLNLSKATRRSLQGEGEPSSEIATIIDHSKQNRLRAFYEYSSMVFDLVEQINDYVCWTNDGHFLCSSEFSREYLPAARELAQVPFFVENKEYATAFLKTFKVVKLLNQKNENFSVPEGLIKYLTLAADIVAADSSTHIKDILDAAILPLGTFRVKRYSTRSVFVNAYVGGGGGGEWLDVDNINQKWGYHFSPFGLLGIDFSWGSQKPSKEVPFQTQGNSSGFFVSILDLGSIVSYRFQAEENDSLTVSKLPPIRWEEILSPGLFYIRGFENSPISWGLGVQLSPKLRDIRDLEGERVATANAFRFSTFIAVDLPVFTVSSKNKRIEDARFGYGLKDEVEALQFEINELTKRLFNEPSLKKRQRLTKEIERKEKELKKLKRKLYSRG